VSVRTVSLEPMPRSNHRENTMHVLLHGIPGNTATWEAVLRRAEDRRVEVLPFPLEGYADDVEASVLAGLDRMPAEHIRLCGVSYGGYLAARLAPRLGPRLEHLVLVGALPRISPEGAQMRRELLAQLDAGVLPIAQLRDMTVELFLGEALADASAANMVDASLQHLDAAGWRRFGELTIQLQDRSRWVSEYETPAIVLHGARDRAVPLGQGESLARLGRQARFVTVDTSAHLLEVTHPDLVSDALFGSLTASGA
jgi:pimeloyl-ACP methyl ester carboxylesterase